MNTLLYTVAHRPYVFVFLLAFAVLATLHMGWARTLLWIVFGYAVAFLSEFSSIRNGFPYGEYHYIYDNLQGELLWGGVPVWDSLSYVFIAYASYATAWFLIEPVVFRGSIDPHISPSKPFAVTALGSLLMMLADGVIDPVANLGEKWFLGKIYFYPDGGPYFGVPLSNFAGWLLVGCAIIAGFQLLEKFVWARLRLPVRGAQRFPGQAFLGPLFYLGIAAFNIGISFWIGATTLAFTSLLLLSPLIFCLVRKFNAKPGV